MTEQSPHPPSPQPKQLITAAGQPIAPRNKLPTPGIQPQEPSQQITIEPKPVVATETPGTNALDSKIADTFNKIKEAQEELTKAQEQAMAALRQDAPQNVGSETYSPEPVEKIKDTPAAPTPSQENVATASASPILQPNAAGVPPVGMKPGRPPVHTAAAKPKTMIYITIALVILIGGIGAYMYFERVEQQKDNDQITLFRNLGQTLNQRAAELALNTEYYYTYRYSPDTYPGITIPTGKKNAQLLINLIKKSPDHQWENELHVLCIMAVLDPSIADMVFNDIKSSYKQYSPKKLNLLASIISSQKNEELLGKLLAAADFIGKTDISRQAELIKNARFGFSPANLPELTDEYLNQEKPKPLRDALSPAFPSLIHKATEAQKEQVAQKILSALDGMERKNMLPYLSLLAQTGLDKALNHLTGMLSNDEAGNKIIISALGNSWPNDSLYQVLIDMLEAKKFTNEKVIRSLKSLALLQLGYNNRERTNENGLKMYNYFINEANDEKDPKEQARKKKTIINSLGYHYPQEYVSALLEKYKEDKDPDIARMANNALDKVKARGEKRDAPKKTRKEIEDEIDAIMKQAFE